MVRVLLSRRVLAFTGLAAVVIPAFILLGFWQWDRFEQRLAADRQQEANAAADPVDYAELAGADRPLNPGDRWRATTVTGEYDASHELYVRNRTSEYGSGFQVVTPLVTEDGTAVLVNRGWVPRPDRPEADPEVPAPPTGRVTVTGRAEVSETEATTGIADRDALPDGQIMHVDVPAIAAELPYPVAGGFVELTEQDPPQDEALVPVELTGYNWGLNLAYAVQWWVFAVIAAGGWVVLLRRERAEGRSRGDDGDAADGAPPAPGPPDAAPSAGGDSGRHYAGAS